MDADDEGRIEGSCAGGDAATSPDPAPTPPPPLLLHIIKQSLCNFAGWGRKGANAGA